jgi:DNA replication protein DnaC
MLESNFLFIIFLVSSLSFVLYLLVKKKLYHPLEYVYLCLLPEKNATLSLASSRALITKISQSIHSSNIIFQALNINPTVTFQIIADKTNGLRMIIAVPIKDCRLVTDLILSSTHKIQVQKIAKEVASIGHPLKVDRFKLAKHYSMPFITQYTKDENDRLDPLISSINNLNDNESMSLELDIHKAQLMRLEYLKKRLLEGNSPPIFSNSLPGHTLSSLWSILRFFVGLLRFAIYLIEIMLSSSKKLATESKLPAYVSKQQSVEQLDKLYEQIFRTNVTLRLYSPDKNRMVLLANEFGTAITEASKSRYQKLVKSHNPFLFSQLMSATEIANYYHITEHDELKHIYSTSSYKQLPPPKLNSGSNKQSILLGTNSYKGQLRNIYLNDEDRQKHLLITGTTGSGKSSLMANNILNDIKKGKGVTVIDPHGDLADDLIKNIPLSRSRDVIYFNPIDLRHPIGINLLDTKSQKGSLEYKIEVDQLVECLISLFRKQFASKEVSSHRIEYLLRNTIHTALTVKNCTMFTIYRILNEQKFRLKVVSGLNDANLKRFWQEELGKAGDYQRVKMSAGVTTKIGRFLFSEPARRVFGQVESTIDFNDIIDTKKILICNFSKGLLGEEGSRLFGTSVLTKLQLSSLATARSNYRYRKEHFLYVDEFHNFSTESFVQMLAESRKYKLFLTISEQSLSSQDETERSMLLANIGSLINFRTSSPNDEKILLNFYKPQLESGDLMNLPLHYFYLKLSSSDQNTATSCKGIGSLMADSRLKAREIIEMSQTSYGFKPVSAS